MVVRVAGSHLGIVADSEQERSQRKPVFAIQGARRRHWESKRTSPQVVREDVQIFVPEVYTEANHVPAQDEGEVVAVLIRVLNLLQGMAEQSRGRQFTPENVEQVVELLANKVQMRESRQDSNPWEGGTLIWWTLGVLVGLLTLEWLGRKGLDLP